jgi:ribosome-associated toxin RatA of RatAB toxin-antitoxin module
VRTHAHQVVNVTLFFTWLCDLDNQITFLQQYAPCCKLKFTVSFDFNTALLNIKITKKIVILIQIFEIV